MYDISLSRTSLRMVSDIIEERELVTMEPAPFDIELIGRATRN
jgi:hypothetical protein